MPPPTPPLGVSYHPFDPAQIEDPYGFYARARQAPIFFSEDIQAFVVTRYDEVRSVLDRPELFSSRDALRLPPEAAQQLQGGPPRTMINTDGSDHQRFRVPLEKAFRAVPTHAVTQYTTQVAERLLDAMLAEEQGQQADLVERFAAPLPMEVILWLFGVPQADVPLCRQWSDDMQSLLASPQMPPARRQECIQSAANFQAYFASLIQERRQHPGQDDLVSLLVQEALDLSEEELFNTLNGVLLAGHETSRHMLSSACWLLLQHPTAWQELRGGNDRLLATALEEVLRYESPVHAFYRAALRAVELGGTSIPEGALVLLVYASANRDEAQFEDAAAFQPARSPNRHLAFGGGPHACLGRAIATTEGRAALRVLNERLPHLRLRAGQPIIHLPQLQFRGLAQLWVEW